MFRRDFGLCLLILFAPTATAFADEVNLAKRVHSEPPFTAAPKPATLPAATQPAATQPAATQPAPTQPVPAQPVPAQPVREPNKVADPVVRTTNPVASKIEWQKNLDVGRQTMAKTQRPMLLYLTAPSCQYCEMMKLDTFAQQWIIREVNKKYTPVMINGREHKNIADKLGVRMFPATAVVHPNGKLMKVVQGYKSPAEFVKYMAVSAAKLKIESDQVANNKRKRQNQESPSVR